MIMPLSQMQVLKPLRPFLDTCYLATVFEQGCLAASPLAATAEDPLVYHGPEENEEIPLLFSDLLDSRFREPKDIIRMSNITQGVKS